MIRLSDFITKIRNCKTQAEERAETQKEMAAIRQSFSKNQENLRLRNVTKLLFINMMGQDTDFGQMECLKLITANTFIEKRIGYLGLTQIFSQRSELLMMATNRIRIDLASSNNYIVALTLSVLSQICTAELSKEVAPLILTVRFSIIKIISNGSPYVKKKAILTATRIVRRSPELISEFLPKVEMALDDKQHGVLLGAVAFLETALVVDEGNAPRLTKIMPKLYKIMKSLVSSQNPEYEISGACDPFLQVAILKFLRYLYKVEKSIGQDMSDILVMVHENILTTKNSTNIKNGAHAVLFECFQAMISLELTQKLKETAVNMVSKFVSVKDANSKYLTLYSLNLLSKYDIGAIQNYRTHVYECLNENDILIRTMALDLLYVISTPENVFLIVKDLLNTLLNANDDEFIAELSLKICLIVDKQSPNRRWYFDTILKVLILAGQSVKEESVSSLVHLITSTPQLQSYAMIKLFFSATENIQNQALGKVVLYMIGEFGQVLLANRQVTVTEDNLFSLIENLILRVGASDDTISYGLSCLFKLAEKTRDKKRIMSIIKNFESSTSYEVQKRACEYIKLLEPEWNDERKKEICIPIPILASAVEMFRPIPIGNTDGALDQLNLTMPEKVDYTVRMENEAREARQVKETPKTDTTVAVSTGPALAKVKSAPQNDDIFNMMDEPEQPKAVSVPPPTQPVVQKTISAPANSFDDIFFGGGSAPATPVQPVPQPVGGGNMLGGLNGAFGTPAIGGLSAVGQPTMGFNMFGTPAPVATQPTVMGTGLGGLNLLGGPSQPAQPNPNLMGTGFNLTQPATNTGGFDLLGGLGSTSTPPPQPVQPTAGFNLLGGPSQPVNTGFNLLGTQPQPQQQNNFLMGGLGTPSTSSSFKAYETQHLQITMNCQKDGPDSATIMAMFNNKTGSPIQNIVLQSAVMKHLKLTVKPLTSSSLQPYSRNSVSQEMKIVNTNPSQKGIVMKIKLMYTVNGERMTEEGKISNFPEGL